MKILLILCLLLLSGCQDQKNLLNLLFPSSMCIDIEDGKYVVGLQIDNLNSIAKTELESSSNETRLLVAVGKGNTIEDALQQITQEERSVIDLSHLKSIILKEKSISEPYLNNIMNYFIFNEDIRKDTEMYYTNHSMKELYGTSFQISRSELFIRINSQEYKQTNYKSENMSLIEVIKAYEDKGAIIHLPILSINQSDDIYINTSDSSKQSVYEIEKVIYLNNDKPTIINISDLQGLQWTSPHRKNIEINIHNKNGDIAAYSNNVMSYLYFNPKDKKYYLKGEINVVVTRDTKNRQLDELEKIVKKSIYEDIINTYKTSLESNIDLYNVTYQSLLFGSLVSLNESNFVNMLDVDIHIKGSYVGNY